MKKSYAFVGASSRALDMFLLPMKNNYQDACELCGIYDINPGRARVVAEQVGIPVYDGFEEMIEDTKPDCVIVTTVDAYHSDYVIKAMELGCDVITEKPMTIDAERCRAILETEKRTGRHVTVTFNYLYAPFMTKIKELVASGTIGEVFSVHFEWLLDRNMDVLAHGTSYFRRWNARMEKSGGLLVHKSTHHFDLVNWWINQRPSKVSAFGRLNLYGASGSERYANGIHGENCRKCEYTTQCPFYYKLNDKEIKLYANNEQYDGYYKDGCVYSKDINIYDTMAVLVHYDKGAILNYSLNATCAYEGWRISINGSNGRLEAYMPETGPDRPGYCDIIRVFDLKNSVTEHKITRASGGHGGGDQRLQRMIFKGDLPDSLGHQAGSVDGAASILIGAAANISIRENRVVSIDELVDFQKI